ncbi:accessory gene regulator B family protein [Pseudobutyrivibrio sp. UC1225]|uniref:accessory gene regulator B family protein n=1 Tax=Pseudobutyrivibrio sp. UC1225 TaxID=1798185 RepID=UPI000B823A9D|nr:accessory gene regulator B family protein [Pseudobutyrivibrio sp. UC1225]
MFNINKIEKFILTNSDNEEEKEILYFGVERFLIFCFGIIIILLSGVLLDELPRTLVFVTCIFPLRQNAGGFHFNDSKKCTVCSLGLLIISIKLMKIISLSSLCAILLSLISTGFILYFAPVGNKNRELDELERKVYGRRTKCICLVENFLLLSFIIVNANNWYQTIIFAEMITSFLVILGVVQEQYTKGEKY